MRLLLPFVLLTLPYVSHAQSIRNFKEFVGFIMGINQMLVAVIFALTFIVLAWTVVKTWIISGGDDKQIENGKKTITVGIIALVVMSGIWGILAILRAGIFNV